MDVDHQTRTTINVDDRLYTITCTCGAKTLLELCGRCDQRPAVHEHVCANCRDSRD